jgi:dihydroxyacetone kinase DhaKLM complex PTS-EIIA-like component DhaM
MAASRARSAGSSLGRGVWRLADELVAQDEELEIFGGVAAGELGEQLNRAA